MDVPVIDVGALVTSRHDAAGVAEVSRSIDDACRSIGFFTIVGHGIDAALRQRLDAEAAAFFALDDAEKAEIAMARGGRAWRGWFPPGGELTSGTPDRKEGVYFGSEIPPDDPRVVAGRPLHGPNLFPRRPATMRATVLAYLDRLNELAQAVLGGIAVGLGLERDWFRAGLTRDPTVLFRMFHYPPSAATVTGWGVAEHTDYGLLTILGHDGTPGLEVRARDGWRAVDVDATAFVCNIGDMLERMTGGRYVSTAHRVRAMTDRSRRSYPFFIDPGWDERVPRVRGAESAPAMERWDGSDPHVFEGTYGEYLTAKVAKVFPGLGADLLPGGPSA